MYVAETINERASRMASAIGDAGRARMLFSLMDGRARTATELALVTNVTASTASVHLNRLSEERLVKVEKQGKHRYYTLNGPKIASLLTALLAVSGAPDNRFKPNTPNRLCAARTCYDHIAGVLGVSLHDRMIEEHWLLAGENTYTLTAPGEQMFRSFGIDIDLLRQSRRKFAGPCLDWSERRPHLGGALGSAILKMALQKKWVATEPEGRALQVTGRGRRALAQHFGPKLFSRETSRNLPNDRFRQD
jgi:DNA-binding transcriptional ArsR family regulator